MVMVRLPSSSMYIVCPVLLHNAESVCKNGDARLVGGSSHSAGILEICSNSVWMTVCRNYVDSREANLICRHIGYLPIGKL